MHVATDEISYINCLVTDISATVVLYDYNNSTVNVFYEEG